MAAKKENECINAAHMIDHIVLRLYTHNRHLTHSDTVDFYHMFMAFLSKVASLNLQTK